MTDALILITIIVVFPIVAIWGLRVFRKLQRKPKEQKKSDTKTHIIRELMNLIFIPIGKFAWNGRNAPDGSLNKIIWQLFLASVITYGFWIIMGFIDRRVNRQDVHASEGYIDQDFK